MRRVALFVKKLLCAKIDETFPPKRTGRPRGASAEHVVDSLYYLIRSGCQWRMLPNTKIHWTNILRFVHKCVNANIFDDVYKKVVMLYKRRHPAKFYAIDSTMVKNAFGRSCTGRNPTDRGRQGSKVSVVVDHHGVVYSLVMTGANHSDTKLLETTLSASCLPLQTKLPLYADKGYDSKANRCVCQKHSLFDRISRRKYRTSRTSIRCKRIIVENTFSWIDKYRRLLLQYEVCPRVHCAYTQMALLDVYCCRFSFE